MKAFLLALARPFLLAYYNWWDVKRQIRHWAMIYEKYFDVKSEDFYAAVAKFDIRVTDIEFTRLIIDLPQVTFHMAYEASGKKSKVDIDDDLETDKIADDKWAAGQVHILFVRDRFEADEENAGMSQSDLFVANEDIISAKHYALLNLSERELEGIPFDQFAFDNASITLTSSRDFDGRAVNGYWDSDDREVCFLWNFVSFRGSFLRGRSALRAPLLN